MGFDWLSYLLKNADAESEAKKNGEMAAKEAGTDRTNYALGATKDELGNWYTAKGEKLDPDYATQMGTTSPYRKLSSSEDADLFRYNPEEANRMQQANMQAYVDPLTAQRNADTTKKIAVNQYFKPLTTNTGNPLGDNSDAWYARQHYGSEGNYNQNVLDFNDASTGTLPERGRNQGNTGLITSQTGLSNAQFENAQLPVTQGIVSVRNATALDDAVAQHARGFVSNATLDQKALNDYAVVTKQNPLEIELQIAELKGELKREPTKQEALQYLEANRLAMAKGEAHRMPYTQNTANNDAIRSSAMSYYGPVVPATASKVNPDGTVTPYTKIPGGMTDQQIMMDNIGNFGGAVSAKRLGDGLPRATFAPENLPAIEGQGVQQQQPAARPVAKPAARPGTAPTAVRPLVSMGSTRPNNDVPTGMNYSGGTVDTQKAKAQETVNKALEHVKEISPELSNKIMTHGLYGDYSAMDLVTIMTKYPDLIDKKDFKELSRAAMYLQNH